jgi:hypothetical protein
MSHDEAVTYALDVTPGVIRMEESGENFKRLFCTKTITIPNFVYKTCTALRFSLGGTRLFEPVSGIILIQKADSIHAVRACEHLL